MPYKNLEQTKEYNKQYYFKNKDKHVEYRFKRKDKIKEYNKEYNLKNKEKKKEYALIKNYNLTIDEYNKMFTDQKGCCKICDRHQNELSKRLGVDHNHTTGKIRGLLCDSCNTNIGKFNEDTRILNKMIEYIKEHNE